MKINMNEHEKLKCICDKIGYEVKWDIHMNWLLKNEVWTLYFEKLRKNFYKVICLWETRNVDVREIIFTQDFMEKYISYIDKNISPWIFVKREKWELVIPEIHDWLIRNLDNPVDYLYNLIKNTWDTN